MRFDYPKLCFLLLASSLLLPGCSSSKKKVTSPVGLPGMPMISIPTTQLFIENDKGKKTELSWELYTESGWTASSFYSLRTWIRLPQGFKLEEFSGNDCELVSEPMPDRIYKGVFDKNSDHRYFGVDLHSSRGRFKAKIVEEDSSQGQEIRLAHFTVETHIKPPLIENDSSCSELGVEFIPEIPEIQDHSVSPFIALQCLKQTEARLEIVLFYPSDSSLWLPSVAEWNKTPGKAVWYFDLTDLSPYRRSLLARFFVHQQNTSFRYDILWNPRASLR